MNSAAFDIMQFLNDAGYGSAGTDLFSFEWGQDQNGEVDRQTLVLDQDAITSDLKEHYEQPVFQILVRGNKRDSGKIVYDRARLIFEFMIAQGTPTINGTEYLEFEPISSVSLIGRDDNDRFVATMNFYTYRNPV